MAGQGGRSWGGHTLRTLTSSYFRSKQDRILNRHCVVFCLVFFLAVNLIQLLTLSQFFGWNGPSDLEPSSRNGGKLFAFLKAGPVKESPRSCLVRASACLLIQSGLAAAGGSLSDTKSSSSCFIMRNSFNGHPSVILKCPDAKG